MINELEIRKSTTLNAFVKSENENVLHLTATINESGNVNYNKIIQNKELYKINIEEIDSQVELFE